MAELLKSLNIDGLALLSVAILFLALVQILDKVFWKKIGAHLDARKQNIASAYKAVDDTRAEMERLRAEYQARLNAMEAAARGRIQEMVSEVQGQREAMLAQAREESAAEITRGLESIDREKREVLVTLGGNLEAIAITALRQAAGAVPDSSGQATIREIITAGLRN